VLFLSLVLMGYSEAGITKPAVDPFLSQFNPVHILTPYISKITFESILPSTPGCPMWSLPLSF